jgi:lysozyme
MKPRHQATRAAVELIKQFEGFRSKAAQLPDGRWTIGYGHTRTAREGSVITEADADALLIYDVSATITAINEWVFTPLTQNQFDGLVAFVFSIGLANFRHSSVLRRLNEGALLQAACAMEMWRTADFGDERIVVDALVRRRSAEMALFLTPQDGFIPVPSLVVAPRVDNVLVRHAPLVAADLKAPMDGGVAEVMRVDAPERDPAMAARAAAEGVVARLHAILREEVAHPPLGGASETPPALEDERAVVTSPPVHTAAASAPEPDSEPAAAPMASASAALERLLVPAESEVIAEPGPETWAPAVHPLLGPKPVAFQNKLASTARRREGKRAPAPALVMMGLLGLGGAAAGAFFGFDANAAESFPMIPDPHLAGAGVSLGGIALLTASVYLLMNRLAASRD